MIAHIISSALRRKLLVHYFSHPDEKYYVHELAVLLNLDSGNLSRELKRFAQEGLFEIEQKGKIKFYHLNLRHPLYGELKQIVFKTEGVEGSLREAVNQFPEIELAFIYGSYAKGEEKTASDIDLMVVGSPDRKSFTSRIRTLEDRLQREINFNLYAPKEFHKKRFERGSFLAQVIRGKKIVLRGSLNG